MKMTPEIFKTNRKSLNLTQSQLADKLGLSPKNGRRYISMIENGERMPRLGLVRLFEYILKE